MKHVSVLIPKGNSIVDTISSSYNLLRMANNYAKRLHGKAEDVLKVELVGIDMEPVIYNGVFQVTPQKTIETVQQTDLIVVPAIDGNIDKAVAANQPYISWITQQRIENNAEIAALCRGAVLLAETGLVNGKSCATHWIIEDEFKKRYPKVNLIPEKIISEDNGIYTSGGAYSFLNFLLYLIERYFGREVAIWCSKISEVEFDRLSQNHFTIFSGQKEHDDKEVKTAQEYIEVNFSEKFNIEELANMVHVSARSFLRRFKKATSNTPTEYIQRVKVEAAKKQLESTALHIQEVMIKVGYLDEKAFRNIFKKYTGISPVEYRSKYNREIAFS